MTWLITTQQNLVILQRIRRSIPTMMPETRHGDRRSTSCIKSAGYSQLSSKIGKAHVNACNSSTVGQWDSSNVSSERARRGTRRSVYESNSRICRDAMEFHFLLYGRIPRLAPELACGDLQGGTADYLRTTCCPCLILLLLISRLVKFRIACRSKEMVKVM